MNVLLTGTAGFALAMLLHATIWRLLRPKSPARALAACTCLALLVSGWMGQRMFPGLETPGILEALLLTGSLAAAYLISLPGIESESPSLLIVTLVESRGDHGADDGDLAKVINDETFALNRIRSLATEGLVSGSANALRITPRGRRFLGLFTAYHSAAGRMFRGG